MRSQPFKRMMDLLSAKTSYRKGAKAAEGFDFSVAGDQPSLKLWHGKEAGNGKPPRRFAAEVKLPAGRAGFGLPASQRKAKQLKTTLGDLCAWSAAGGKF